MAQSLFEKRRAAKGQFTRTEKMLKHLIADPDSVMSSTIERRYQEHSLKWLAVQETHDAYVSKLLESAEDTSRTEQKEEEWLDELADRFLQVEMEADKVIAKFKQDKSSAVKKETAPANTLEEREPSVQNVDHQSSGVQLERIKLEKFNGDIRRYPKFKEQFELYVKPLCTPTQLPFVLRSHLMENVQEEVDNVDDDLNTLWERLDKKFGNNSRLIDVILADISKAPKGDSKNTLIMINTVEKAYRDLARMNKESEIKNGTILSMIEKKLPEEIRLEWLSTIAEMTEEDSEEKFDLLMKLLRKWRIMIEYDQSAIRKPTEKKSLVNFAGGSRQQNSKNTCWIHTAEKHPIWVCQSFKAKSVTEKMDMVKEEKACQACLEKSCPGVSDPENCKKRFKCPIDGCKKAHNKLLHQ